MVNVAVPEVITNVNPIAESAAPPLVISKDIGKEPALCSIVEGKLTLLTAKDAALTAPLIAMNARNTKAVKPQNFVLFVIVL